VLRDSPSSIRKIRELRLSARNQGLCDNAAIIAILVVLWLRTQPWAEAGITVLFAIQMTLVYLMLAATIGSGVQYIVKAARQYR
jgi:hypothetical protein